MLIEQVTYGTEGTVGHLFYSLINMLSIFYYATLWSFYRLLFGLFCDFTLLIMDNWIFFFILLILVIFRF